MDTTTATNRVQDGEPAPSDTGDQVGGPVFPCLPTEVLVDILGGLSGRDLVACACTNSYMCAVALPLLYQHIRLTEFKPWPTFASPARGPWPKDGPELRSRSDLTSHVRRLDIWPHKTTDCHRTLISSAVQPPIVPHSCLCESDCWHVMPGLPNLRIVRVRLKAYWSGNRVFHTNVDAHGHNPQPGVACGALAHLRAPMLVMRGLTLAHSTVPRSELPQRFMNGVRHMITVLQPDHPYFLPRNPMATASKQAVLFCARIPNNVTRLTIVFYPPSRGYAWRAGPGNYTLSWELVQEYIRSLFASLARWMLRNDHHTALVTIVNAGALQRRVDDGTPLSDESVETAQAEVWRTFDYAFNRETWKPSDKDKCEKARKRLRLLRMEDWIKSDDEWRDAFDEEEVRPWHGDPSATAYKLRQDDDPFAGIRTVQRVPARDSSRHLPLFQLSVSSID